MNKIKTIIEQLKGCSPTNFLSALKSLCDEYGYTRYLIDFSISEAVYFIPGGEECMLLCVAFSTQANEQRYLDSAGFSLTEHAHCTSPLSILHEKYVKLEDLCRKYNLPRLSVFLVIATEYRLLNSEKDREQWYKNGIGLVLDEVDIPCEDISGSSCYNKYLSLSDFLSAKR